MNLKHPEHKGMKGRNFGKVETPPRGTHRGAESVFCAVTLELKLSMGIASDYSSTDMTQGQLMHVSFSCMECGAKLQPCML